MQDDQPIQLPADHHLQKGMTGAQKWGIAALVFFLLIISGFWYSQLYMTLRAPGYGGLSREEFEKKQMEALDENATTMRDAEVDTDGDGLTDWEELNLYNTSPYLADIDGDGLNDKEEIEGGTDPHCKEGTDCYATELRPDDTGDRDSSGSVTDQPQDNQDQAEDGGGMNSADILKEAFGENPEPEVLRQRVLEITTDEGQRAIINALSDEELLKFYEQMISNNNNLSQ